MTYIIISKVKQERLLRNKKKKRQFCCLFRVRTFFGWYTDSLSACSENLERDCYSNVKIKSEERIFGWTITGPMALSDLNACHADIFKCNNPKTSCPRNEVLQADNYRRGKQTQKKDSLTGF